MDRRTFDYIKKLWVSAAGFEGLAMALRGEHAPRGLDGLHGHSAGLGGKDKNTTWCTGIIFWLVFDFLALSPFLVGLLAFSVYWGVPLAFAIWNGTLITIPTLKGYSNVFAGHAILQSSLALFARTQVMSDGMPYLLDRVHFIFAILVAIASVIGTIILRKMGSDLLELHSQGIPVNNFDFLHANFDGHRRAANHWIGRGVSLILAAGGFYVFYGLYQDQEVRYWWGSATHGCAGLLLAVVVSIMIYFGTQGMFLITVGALMIARMFRKGLQLRPYHPDGCNGLSVLGNLILLLWIISIVLVGAIYVVFGLGYFGLQRTQLAWILAVIGIFTIPCVAIIPLWAAMQAAIKAKHVELCRLEPAVDQLYRTTVESLQSKPVDEILSLAERLSQLETLHQFVDDLNIWPFNRHALAFVMSVYVIETLLTLHQIFNEMRLPL